MAQLAIKGHVTRGYEAIEILGLLGGINAFEHIGNNPRAIYYITETCKNFINCSLATNVYDYIIFTLEEFLEKFPYKVGDKVLINDCDDDVHTITSMIWDDDLERVVYRTQDKDGVKSTFYWYADEMIPYKEETMEGKLISNEEMSLRINISQMEKRQIIFSADAPNETELVLGDNFEIKVEDGKTYVVRKKPQYPKTYKECCEVLGIEEDLWFVYEDIDDNHINPACISNYRIRNLDLYHNLEKLKICRDAYWKIAGEQMGLDKPWEPDWKSSDLKYVIKTMGDEICKPTECTINCFLAFPTEEMRDVFLKYFKDLIERCKELI